MPIECRQSLEKEPFRQKLLKVAPSVMILAFASSFPANVLAANSVLPPFPPGLFYPVDRGTAPTIPGATLVPSRPIFDFAGIPGWIHGKKVTNSMKVTIPKYEMLVIRGSRIKNGKVVIPAGGLYFDASPARGELPMTGASDYFLGKRYYFVDYDARIHIVKNVKVFPKKLTVAGNHLYTMLLPPVPKVIPNPIVIWRTFDGVSIRPWAFTERWENPSPDRPDQKPMTYLQGVIQSAGKKGVTFASLTGTSIHREWWAQSKLFEGSAKEGQIFGKGADKVVIKRIEQNQSRVTVDFIHNGRKILSRTLVTLNSATLPEDPSLRSRMIAIHGSMAVVLWPHDAIEKNSVHLWVYGGVARWDTNRMNFGIRHVAYFPIACPIAHHIGAMIYNTRALALSPGKPVSLFGGYARIKVVSIEGDAVKFIIETEKGSTPVFSKNGNIDAVIGGGRAAHGILSTLDTTDLNLADDFTITK